MAAITAQQVQKLREKTGLAMMDVKKALVEASGDEGGALDILRKKFADKMEERGDREVANGRIGVYADGNCAAMVELRCETDFVATNNDFKGIADALAKQCATSGITDPDEIKKSNMEGGQSVQEFMTDAFGKIKENIQIKRFARLEGAGAVYVHHNGQSAAAITGTADPGDAGRKICMHITSAVVLEGRVREDVDASVAAEAKAKAAEEAAGKPQEIIDKIVDGKMDKWYAERVLVEQPFVMDDKKSVGEFAKENGFEVTGYQKFEVGEITE